MLLWVWPYTCTGSKSKIQEDTYVDFWGSFSAKLSYFWYPDMQIPVASGVPNFTFCFIWPATSYSCFLFRFHFHGKIMSRARSWDFQNSVYFLFNKWLNVHQDKLLADDHILLCHKTIFYWGVSDARTFTTLFTYTFSLKFANKSMKDMYSY